MASVHACLVLHGYTCDFGFKWASGDVVRAAVFDCDDVVSRSHWSVVNFKSFRTLLTLHFHLRWALDGHSQRSRSSFGVIDDKLGLVSYNERLTFNSLFNN